MAQRRLTLTRFVAATLVTVTTILLTAFGIANYRTVAQTQLHDLEGLTRVQTREIAESLADPMWNIDRPQIDKVLHATMQPESIYGVRVSAASETYGLRRNEQWRYEPWTDKPLPPGLLVSEEPVLFGPNQLGTVRLYVSRRNMNLTLRGVALQLVAAVVSVDLLIIVAVYLALWRAVLRPITELERYAGKISAGTPTLAPSSAGSAAEVESLCTSIHSMVSLLELREERFRSIFESVNDAIFILESETGTILDVNRRMTEMFGYTREEAVTLDLGALSAGVAPYTLESARALIRDFRPGDGRVFEWRARHKDGHVFWVEVGLRAATIGDAPRIVSVVRDVDERKALQEALQRSAQMSMMGGLVAGVAHEVRNPLFGIAATLDAFEAEIGGGEAVAEYLATLRNDVSRLSRLMNDLLDYGRPPQLERHRQSMRPIIAEAVRVCAPRARAKGIEIREEIEAGLPDVSIDADRMLQVLKNVVENALEFSAAGQPVLLRARSETNGHAALVFTIADHGPGFRAEDLPHVFEPFFTRRKGGSGLGLAIVQKIVGEHGGTISASNAPAGGGVVEIRLPV